MPNGKKVKAHRNKKLPWKPMEIFRVPLSPDQAILTCCQASTRSQPWNSTEQCYASDGCQVDNSQLITS